jgi:TatD DNase family protein
MIDAHTHLYSDKYRQDLDQVIQRAQNRLKAVVVSAVDIESLERSLAIRQRYPNFIYVTGGIHPRKAAELKDDDSRRLWRAVGRFRQELVAVGEVGPDFHHVRKQRDQQRQLLVLEEALRRAEEWDLPLVVHARKAEAEALEVLSRSKTPVMFHCYAGSRKMAGRIAACGFYLSLSAILLFDRELQETVKQIPVEQILTETDSPALSPRRGHKRNEPAYIEKIVVCLAKLLQYSLQKTAEITAANAIRFYRLPDISKKIPPPRKG